MSIRAGFIPLVDCAPLVVAAEKGFARAEGIAIELIRETSWANIRDRVAIGHFDVAHMVAPLPIAASLGLFPLSPPMIAPIAFGLGGNAVTVARDLWRAMAAEGGADDPLVSLRAVIAARRRRGEAVLTFAVVFPFSPHNYDLRHWLAAGGIHPDRDVRITAVPPPFMVDALREGMIDGFCVGEPWNILAAQADVGVIVATKADIWRSGPDKVLGLRQDWAERRRDELTALIRAIHHAARWCGDAANRTELAALLARPDCLDKPAELVRHSLEGRLPLRGGEARPDPDFLVFDRAAATFPWKSHALWFYSQMVRWGHAPFSDTAAARAGAAYRPDLYRAALQEIDSAMPGVDAKVEGAPEEGAPGDTTAAAERPAPRPGRFCDGRVFDPDRLRDYIAGFDIRAERTAAADLL